MLSPWLHIPSGDEHLPSKATSRDKSQRLIFLTGTQQKHEFNERASGHTRVQTLSGLLSVVQSCTQFPLHVVY